VINEVSRQEQLSFMEAALNRQPVSDVADYIREQVMPKVEKNIQQFAIDAVSTWSTKLQDQNSMTMMGNTTEITATFVEEVLNKVYKENQITIKVKGKE
jgi:hypothetical protein